MCTSVLWINMAAGIYSRRWRRQRTKTVKWLTPIWWWQSLKRASRTSHSRTWCSTRSYLICIHSSTMSSATTLSRSCSSLEACKCEQPSQIKFLGICWSLPRTSMDAGSYKEHLSSPTPIRDTCWFQSSEIKMSWSWSKTRMPTMSSKSASKASVQPRLASSWRLSIRNWTYSARTCMAAESFKRSSKTCATKTQEESLST